MHHVTARSIAEERIFKDSGDYTTGIRILAEIVDEGLLVCHEFCFMPTHYHVFGTFLDVSTAIHKLNRRYATRYNKRYSRRGHVFDSPFSRREIRTEAHLLHVVRYLALNPKDPESWPFSSYPGLIGVREPFSFVDPTPVLQLFGNAGALRAYVDEGREAEDSNLVPASPGTRFDAQPQSERFMMSPPSDSPVGANPLRS